MYWWHYQVAGHLAGQIATSRALLNVCLLDKCIRWVYSRTKYCSWASGLGIEGSRFELFGYHEDERQFFLGCKAPCRQDFDCTCVSAKVEFPKCFRHLFVHTKRLASSRTFRMTCKLIRTLPVRSLGFLFDTRYSATETFGVSWESASGGSSQQNGGKMMKRNEQNKGNDPFAGFR